MIKLSSILVCIMISSTLSACASYDLATSHYWADTTDDKVFYLSTAGDKYFPSSSEKPSFQKIVGDYKNEDGNQTLSNKLKEELVAKCFYSDFSPSNEASCAYDFFISKTNQIIAQKEETKRQNQIAAQKEEEEIQSTIKYGAEKTDHNFRKYCDLSARLVVQAYLDDAQIPMGIFRPDEKRILKVSDEQYRQLKRNIADNTTDIVLGLRYNPGLSMQLRDAYNIKCMGNPETFITNYDIVFKQ